MTQDQKIIRAKVGLLELAKQLGNVSQACKMMGYSRDSFYRFKELRQRRRAGVAGYRPPEADPEEPDTAGHRTGGGRNGDRAAGLGPGAGLGALKRRGLSISPAGVRCVWQRHDLISMKLRVKALDAKEAQEGILLTEAQIAALEKVKTDKEAHGDIEGVLRDELQVDLNAWLVEYN